MSRGRFDNNRGGRGRGRGAQRTGRGSHRSNNNHRNGNSNNEMKFTPHGYGNNRQAATYEKVKDHIVQYVQKNYENGIIIATSLSKLEKNDFTKEEPTLDVVTEGSEQLKEAKGKQNEYKFKAELTRWLDKQDRYKDNLAKAYALICSQYCTTSMQHRIKEHPEYESKIVNDPIELLKKIQTLMHDPVRSRYGLASVTEAMKQLVTLRQLEGEPLTDYYARFKQAKNTFKSHGGKNILDEFIVKTPEYQEIEEENEEKRKKFKDKAFEMWMSYLLIRNSDQAKYGSIMTGFISQYTMGHNQYPTTETKAMDILGAHRFDNREALNKKRKENNNNNSNNREQNKSEEDATATTKTESSFAPQGNNRHKDKTCFCCGKKGHISDDCREKPTRKREDWAIKRSSSHHQSDDNVSTVTENTRDDDKSTQTNRSNVVAWSGLQISKKSLHTESNKSIKKKKSILLDNGSTLSIFRDRAMVHNIRTSKYTLELATNAGTSCSNQEGDVPAFGTVWFDEDAIANIFGMSEVKKRYRITYDSEKEDAFLVHTDDKIIKFTCTPEGLYEYVVPDSYLESIAELNDEKKQHEESHVIATVEENKEGFTKRELDRAKAARDLYHIIGAPTIKNYKALLKMNVIKNCPVSEGDVDLAERIYGADISTLKGKTTRSKVKPVKEDYIEIPKEIMMRNSGVELCMDIMYVNKIPMLTTIDKSIRFRGLIPLDGTKHDYYYEGLDVVLRHYNKAGFQVNTIHCDGEFKEMMDAVSDNMNIDMNYTNAQDHVPEAERNNRTIKERIRVAYHRLPYKMIPRTMIKHLAMTQVAHSNLFPAKGGLSSYYSPRMIMSGTNLDYNKDCKIAFGTYVPEAERNNRTIKERIRVAYHRLPYKMIPRTMIKHLAMTQVAHSNLFPAKGGLSSYYSPRMIMSGTNLDYNKDCKIAFGTYVQASTDTMPRNSNAEWTLDAIYSRPNTNIQGGHELMDLHTGAVITRNIVKPLPASDIIIKAVEALAKQQGMTSLKITNQQGELYYDADWIAGVDYDEYDEEYNEDLEFELVDDEKEEELNENDYEKIEQSEIDELTQDDKDDNDPHQHHHEDHNGEEEEDAAIISEEEEEEESHSSENRRSTRISRPVNRLEPQMRGQSYHGRSALKTQRYTTRGKCFYQKEATKVLETQSNPEFEKWEPALRKQSHLQKTVSFEEDVARQLEYCHNLVRQTPPKDDEMRVYDGGEEAMLMARYIDEINSRTTIEGASFGQQYMLKKGLKIFGERGEKASQKELDQLHRRSCFTPISVGEMTQKERRKAQLALMFLTEKRDKSIKGRMVYNGKPTREWLSREDAASPTASLESIMLTAVIDANEERDVMTNDIPNAFIQAKMPEIKKGEDRVIMKITGVLVDLLVELNPMLYGPYVVYERGQKVLYAEVLRAIYGMLEAALLWYKKFRSEA